MFEPVAAAAADDPAILPLRMSVDQEMAVVAILILANPPFGERTAGEVRETPCKIGADVGERLVGHAPLAAVGIIARAMGVERDLEPARRSEEHTSELQSLMRISYAVFCLKKKTPTVLQTRYRTTTIITKD